MRYYIIIIFITIISFSNNAYGQCACCAGASAGSSGNNFNNGLLTIDKKQWVVEAYGDYRTIKTGDGHHAAADSSTEEETPLSSMLISSIGLRYGVSNKFTVSALLPYAFLFTDKGNDKGIGDLILLGTYNMYNKNNFRIALQGGVELPTGVKKGANFDNTTVVVGSGSIDPMAGLTFSKKWDKFTLQGSGLFKYTTKGFDETNYGSLSIQNIFLAYNLIDKVDNASKDSIANTSMRLTLFTGYYGEWLDKIRPEGEVDNNSGYYLGYATLGTSFAVKSWMFPLTVSIPVIQKMNGEQNNSGYRLRLGVVKTF